MILLWGRPGDGPLRSVLDTLAARGRSDDAVLVDQRRYRPLEAALSVPGSVLGEVADAVRQGDGAGRGGWLDARLDGWLDVEGRRVDLADLTGYYVRPYPPAEQEAGPVTMADVAAVDALLLCLAEHAPAHVRVVNRPSAMASNDSKPAQVARIAERWFAVPRTVVTNERAVAQAFWDEHQDVVYKSTSGVRSIAARLTPGHRDRLDRLGTCPTQFQAYVPGVDHRVHVVGEEVFAVRIDTDAVDYRYAARERSDRSMAAVELPDDVADRCVDLTRRLGLLLTGIDLRRTPSGEWFCFEVNTSPAFSWFEDHTGLPIADAVTSLLLGRTTGGRP